MIVWGGWGYDIGAFRTGGRYDPIADKWTATPTWPDCPIARYFHTAVWTGEEMIIWGGEYNGDSQDHIALNSGGRYNPSMNLWMETSTNAFCPSPRQGHSAVWTGSQMIVWGGSAESLNWTSGGIYLPPAVPKPTIVGPAEGCYVTGVQLSTQSFSSYQWYFNDWPIWGSNLQFYTAKQSGTYSVSVNDPNGCPGFSPVISVSIYVAPPVSISGSYLNDCPNPHISLTAGQFSEYQWMYNDIDISGASSQTYEASVSGSYKVKVADGKGCFGESEEHPVIIQFCSTSEVSPSGAVYPLLLTKLTGSPQEIDLSFQKVEQTAGYGVYTGTIGSWYSHGGNPFGRTCDVPIVDFGTGQIHARIAMIPGNHYYLITAHNAIAEGPSGFDSSGMEITKMLSTCAP
jgi:hypothetical protein